MSSVDKEKAALREKNKGNEVCAHMHLYKYNDYDLHDKLSTHKGLPI